MTELELFINSGESETSSSKRHNKTSNSIEHGKDTNIMLDILKK